MNRITVPWFPSGDPTLPEYRGVEISAIHRKFGDEYQLYDLMYSLGTPDLGVLFPFSSKDFVFPLGKLRTVTGLPEGKYLFLQRFTPEEYPWASGYAAALFKILDYYTGYASLSGPAVENWINNFAYSPFPVGGIDLGLDAAEEAVVTWLSWDPIDQSIQRRYRKFDSSNRVWAPGNYFCVFSCVVSGSGAGKAYQAIDQANPLIMFERFWWRKFLSSEIEDVNKNVLVYRSVFSQDTTNREVSYTPYYAWFVPPSDEAFGPTAPYPPAFRLQNLPWSLANPQPALRVPIWFTGIEPPFYDDDYVNQLDALGNKARALIWSGETYYLDWVINQSVNPISVAPNGLLIDRLRVPILVEQQELEQTESEGNRADPSNARAEWALAYLAPANNDYWGNGILQDPLGESPVPYLDQRYLGITNIETLFQYLQFGKDKGPYLSSGLVTETEISGDTYNIGPKEEYIFLSIRYSRIVPESWDYNNQRPYQVGSWYLFFGVDGPLPLIAFSDNRNPSFTDAFAPWLASALGPTVALWYAQTRIFGLQITRITMNPINPANATHWRIPIELAISILNRYSSESQLINGVWETRFRMPDSVRIMMISAALEAEKYGDPATRGFIQVTALDGTVTQIDNTLAAQIVGTGDALEIYGYPGLFESLRYVNNAKQDPIEFRSLPNLIGTVYRELQRTMGPGYHEIPYSTGKLTKYRDLTDQLDDIAQMLGVIFGLLAKMRRGIRRIQLMVFEVLVGLGVRIEVKEVDLKDGTYMALPGVSEDSETVLGKLRANQIDQQKTYHNQ